MLFCLCVIVFPEKKKYFLLLHFCYVIFFCAFILQPFYQWGNVWMSVSVASKMACCQFGPLYWLVLHNEKCRRFDPPWDASSWLHTVSCLVTWPHLTAPDLPYSTLLLCIVSDVKHQTFVFADSLLVISSINILLIPVHMTQSTCLPTLTSQKIIKKTWSTRVAPCWH